MLKKFSVMLRGGSRYNDDKYIFIQKKEKLSRI